MLAVALMLLIYQVSSKPLTVPLDSFPLQDKLVHAIAYGVLASLFLLSMKLTSTGFTARQQLMAIVLATLYGISDEWHQRYIPSYNRQ